MTEKILFLTGFMLFSLYSCNEIKSQDQFYPATEPGIQVTGRFEASSNGYIKFDWPGVAIQVTFTGPDLALIMDDEGENYYDVMIDDGPTVIHHVHSDTSLLLATGLPAGEHRVDIRKRTEGFTGKAVFKGIRLAGNEKIIPREEIGKRRVEFIGNSITCGYGTESESPAEHFEARTENCNKSYASIIARAFEAEAHIIAHSGQGMVRNYGDKNQVSDYVMPDRYKQVFDNQEKPLWNFSDWIPDLVVINLGTNDFSTEPHPEETVFNRAYMNLIRFIRSEYGEIPVFCIAGPMTDEPCYSYVKKMVEGNRKFLSDPHVYFIGIPPYLLAEQDWGADYHPTYSGQVKMAEHVVPVIASVMGWEYHTIR